MRKLAGGAFLILALPLLKLLPYERMRIRAVMLPRVLLTALSLGLGALSASPALALLLVDTDSGSISTIVLGEPIDDSKTLIDSITPITTLNGTPFTSSLDSSGARRFVFKGNLGLADDELIAVGSRPASFIVGNNATITNHASISFNAGVEVVLEGGGGSHVGILDIASPLGGPGGGTGGGAGKGLGSGGPGGLGGTGGEGGEGGIGGGTSLTSQIAECLANFPFCPGGFPGRDGAMGESGTSPLVGGSAGKDGGVGQLGYRSISGGGIGGPGGSGGPAPTSAQVGGEQGTGYPVGGVSGFGVGGFGGGDGGKPTGSASKGTPGDPGSPGSAGLNTGSSSLISGGSCGGGGGQGGGGSGGSGGAGGGGGGGGSGGGAWLVEDPFGITCSIGDCAGGKGGKGGTGGPGGSGGAGGTGGVGGTGGAGGGAFELLVRGVLNVFGAGFSAFGTSGSAGQGGPVQGTGAPGDGGAGNPGGDGGTGGQPAPGGDGGNGGKGGDGGKGAAGGVGGDGGAGGGGAGGTVKLISSVLTGTQNAIVQVFGGSASNDGPAGGDGRFVLGTNVVATGTPNSSAFAGTVRGAQSGSTFAGSRRSNIYLSPAFRQETPYIPDLIGGAEAFGLLPDPAARAVAAFAQRTAPSDAKAGLMLSDKGPVAAFDDDYIGFDWLYLINVRTIDLINPAFGAGQRYLNRLYQGGFENDPLFVPGARLQLLDALGPFDVYATLVPDDIADFCFSGGGVSVKCVTWAVDDANRFLSPVFLTAGVPEPPTLVLLGAALAGLGFARRRKLH